MKRLTPSEPLDERVMECLRGGGAEVSYPAGSVILRRGDPGRAFFVVLSGLVEVVQTGGGGLRLSLARMGEGSFFGEMSLLTGEPASADVVASGPVVLLEYPASLFDGALADCEPLRRRILAGLAAKLRGTSADVWSFFQRSKVLNVLVEGAGHAGPLVARSPRMAKVQAAIPALAASDAPLLITGQIGTGKGYLAGKIHQAGSSEEAPFLVVDCSALDRDDPARFLFGSLRGLPREEVPDAESLPEYGVVHLANGGILLLRNVEELDGSCQEVLSAYLAERARGTLGYPAARIIATTSVDLAGRVSAGTFRAELAAMLGAASISLPTMAERRQDILPLAAQFLTEQERGGSLRLGIQAEHALVSLRYGHRNALELREAVEMAAIVAEGGEIRAEHIFSGPREEGSRLDYNLLDLPWVRRLVSPPVHRLLQGGVLAAFATIVGLCAAGGSSRLGQAANSLVWGLWWPAILVAFAVAGRVWCSVCPLSTAARAVRRIRAFGLAPPAWMKKYGGWIIMLGFLTIVWIENVFHLNGNPRATAALLGSLGLLAVAFGVLFQREAWCRYLCPLGNFGALYSFAAAVNVRANPGVCAACCTTHECYKGTSGKAGCPVFLHPLYARESHHCKLCFGCLHLCPHGSARLYLRPPLQTIWRQVDMEHSLVPFALFVVFLSPGMLASTRSFSAFTAPDFTLVAVAAVVLALAAYRALPPLLSSDPDPDPAVASRISFSLLILAWGPAMAFHLGNTPWLRMVRVSAMAADGSPAGTAGWTLLPLLQVGVILLGALGAAIVLWRLKASLERRGLFVRQAGWKALLAFCVAYLLGSLLLTGAW